MGNDIKLGRITAPVGIKGEVRVFPFTDEATRFSAIKKVYVGGEEMTISNVRYQKNLVILRFKEVQDRNAAELLRNKELTLPREEMYQLDEDSYFTDDLLGMDVEDEEGVHIGTLARIINNPAHDLYEIKKDDGNTFLLPAVKAFVVDVDIENRKMTIHLIEGLA